MEDFSILPVKEEKTPEKREICKTRDTLPKVKLHNVY